MGFSEKQVGRMSYDKFLRLRNAYKNDFDIEIALKKNDLKYSDLEKQTDIDDAIPF
jgi:hypothetical protein